MTAILGMIRNKVPGLIGDVLISSRKPPSRYLKIPVDGRYAAETPIRWNTHYITEYRQKLVQIGPELLVAWTSDMAIEASMAIKHLRAGYEQADKSSLDELQALMFSIEELELLHTALIVLVSNEQGWRLKSFGSGISVFPTRWGEDACSAGVGQDALVYALDTSVEYYDGHNLDPSAEFVHGDAFDQVLGALVKTAARMWYQDICGVGPQLAFGGAYEVAIRQNQKVVKLGDLLYVTFDYDHTHGIKLVPILKKIDYVDDDLVVRILELSFPSPTTNMNFDVIRSEVYLVPPIDKRWTLESPPPTFDELVDHLPTFNASHFAIYVKIDSVDPDVPHHAVTIEGRMSEDPPVTFEYDKDENISSFTTSEWLGKLIEAEIKRLLKSAGEPITPEHFPLTSNSN